MKLIRNLCLLFITGTAIADQTIMVDPYFSPYSGSANLLFGQEVLIQGEDFLFQGGAHRNTTGKVWGRTLEQVCFWLPANMLAAVTQHEFFGHGYRLRELGYTPQKYEIEPFKGATYFGGKDIESMTVGDLLAVTVAGLEAESILARDLKMQWIERGEIDGRSSLMYIQAQQSPFFYTWITHKGELKGDQQSGNDIQSYMFLHNSSYTGGDLTTGKLMHWVAFNWLDPMTFYAFFSYFYYMAEGKAWSFPMIPIGENVRYLPNIKIGYAPYAPEAYLENFFVICGKPLYFYAKGGRRSVGVGLAYDHLFTGRRGSIGIRLDGWNQNLFNNPITLEEFEETGSALDPSLKKRRWGGALSFTGRLNLFSKLALFMELGGKSSGYLPGYALDKAIVARIGLTVGNFRQKTSHQDMMNTAR